MLSNVQLGLLATHIRSKIVSGLDPSEIFSEAEGLRKNLELNHKGLYVGVIGADDKEICRVGFLKEGITNVLDSAETVIQSLSGELKSKNFNLDMIKKSTFQMSIVRDCIYLPDPTDWNDNTDGIYFMWGQKYRALYLPYQIRRMNMSKIEILDRLCSWEAGVVSNLWRLPEGLCFKLVCQNHTS